MENHRLSKKVDNVRTDFEYLIDELVAEIERLEEQNERLKSDVEELQNFIKDLENPFNNKD